MLQGHAGEALTGRILLTAIFALTQLQRAHSNSSIHLVMPLKRTIVITTQLIRVTAIRDFTLAVKTN